MTINACDGTSRKELDHSTEPDACTDEKAAADHAASERAAADRRDEWITGSGGMSTMQGTEKAGKSDNASVWGPNDQAMADRAKKQAEDAKRTAKMDKPLEDDKIGNMIPGLVVGGVYGLARGLGTAAFEGIGGITKEVAKEVGKEVVKDAAKDVAVHTAADGLEETAHEALHAGAHGGPVHDAGHAKETHEAPKKEDAPAEGGYSRPIGPPAPTTCEPPIPYIRVQG